MTVNKQTKVVTIGGGTGSPAVIKALMLAGFRNIKAISAAMDTGGRSGFIRSDERDRVISVGDLLRILLALIPPEANNKAAVEAFGEMAGYTDGRRRNVGYSIYYAMLEKYGNRFLEVQGLFEKLLGVQFAGQAIPVTLKPTNICFRTVSGREMVGEHQMDLYSMSQDTVTDVWIEPDVTASKEALQAIKAAELLVYCPGSMYSSVISNFLAKGVSKALAETKAKKVLITNLVSIRNENHEFAPDDYWRVFQRYTQLEQPIDVMIVPNISKQQFEDQYPKVYENYRHEYSYYLGWDNEDFTQLKSQGVEVWRRDVFSVTQKLHRLRHDSEKLAVLLDSMIL